MRAKNEDNRYDWTTYKRLCSVLFFSSSFGIFYIFFFVIVVAVDLILVLKFVWYINVYIFVTSYRLQFFFRLSRVLSVLWIFVENGSLIYCEYWWLKYKKKKTIQCDMQLRFGSLCLRLHNFDDHWSHLICDLFKMVNRFVMFLQSIGIALNFFRLNFFIDNICLNDSKEIRKKDNSNV